MQFKPIPTEVNHKYPRLCSHRGFNTVAPENTLPAFASAIALGAEEIELDLWPTVDGEIVICHDSTVDRTTDGAGRINELTYEEIVRLDAGCKFSPNFTGVSLPRFEEILALFARKVTMNIHIKSINLEYKSSPSMQQRGKELMQAYSEGVVLNFTPRKGKEVIAEELVHENNLNDPTYNPVIFQKIIDLIDKYNCRDYVYITGEKDVLVTARNLAPEISRCCLEGHMNYTIVENALKYDCHRVQFCKLYLTKEMIDEAHNHNLICNLFWSDNPTETIYFFEQGIDTILTNNFLTVKRGVDSLKTLNKAGIPFI